MEDVGRLKRYRREVYFKFFFLGSIIVLYFNFVIFWWFSLKIRNGEESGSVSVW